MSEEQVKGARFAVAGSAARPEERRSGPVSAPTCISCHVTLTSDTDIVIPKADDGTVI